MLRSTLHIMAVAVPLLAIGFGSSPDTQPDVQPDSTFWVVWHDIAEGMDRNQIEQLLPRPDLRYVIYCDSVEHYRGPGESFCGYQDRHHGFEVWQWKTAAETDTSCVNAHVFVGSASTAEFRKWKVLDKGFITCRAIY